MIFPDILMYTVPIIIKLKLLMLSVLILCLFHYTEASPVYKLVSMKNKVFLSEKNNFAINRRTKSYTNKFQ